jgi:hypothetical protein
MRLHFSESQSGDGQVQSGDGQVQPGVGQVQLGAGLVRPGVGQLQSGWRLAPKCSCAPGCRPNSRHRQGCGRRPSMCKGEHLQGS